MPIMVNADKLYEIKPRSVVFLFSGGKDSAATLALARDAIREYAGEYRARVYVLYIYVTGNTHPLNAYCAYSVGKWHEEHYGFEFVSRARDRLFQEYMAKYGLQKGPTRWCFIEFKEKILREFHRRLPRPVLYIDGMKPSDSKHRSEIITDEFQLIESWNRGKYWAWHPLFNIKSDEEVFGIVKRYKEFECVLRLYEKFGDSLNCIICPYKPRQKILRYYAAEDGGIIYGYMSLVMRSKYFLRKYQPISRNPITYYIGNRG